MKCVSRCKNLRFISVAVVQNIQIKCVTNSGNSEWGNKNSLLLREGECLEFISTYCCSADRMELGAGQAFLLEATRSVPTCSHTGGCVSSCCRWQLQAELWHLACMALWHAQELVLHLGSALCSYCPSFLLHILCDNLSFNLTGTF